jgi:hypothetical protein
MGTWVGEGPVQDWDLKKSILFRFEAWCVELSCTAQSLDVHTKWLPHKVWMHFFEIKWARIHCQMCASWCLHWLVEALSEPQVDGLQSLVYVFLFLYEEMNYSTINDTLKIRTQNSVVTKLIKIYLNEYSVHWLRSNNCAALQRVIMLSEQ